MQPCRGSPAWPCPTAGPPGELSLGLRACRGHMRLHAPRWVGTRCCCPSAARWGKRGCNPLIVLFGYSFWPSSQGRTIRLWEGIVHLVKTAGGRLLSPCWTCPPTHRFPSVGQFPEAALERRGPAGPSWMKRRSESLRYPSHALDIKTTSNPGHGEVGDSILQTMGLHGL